MSSEGGWSDADGHPVDVPRLPTDRYRIEGLLGRGGMGEVYRAWDTHLTRYVALKRVHTAVGLDPNRLARLLREAQVTARLDHPGIVPVLDLGTTADGALFYTMRLIAGRTLLAARADLSTPQLVRHFADAVQAVAFAHARGIIHRDLKPENIMVGGFGETQVVDWGLARALDQADVPLGPGETSSGGQQLTRVGHVLGTERYLSPEAAQGLPMGPPDDVYALGATLVELLTGERGDWFARAGALADRELSTIACRALAKVDERYPDAGELSEAVQAYLDGRPVGGHNYTLSEVARRAAHRWRWPLRVGLAATLAAVSGLGIAGVGVLRERDRAVAAEHGERAARIAGDQTLARSLAHQALLALREQARPEAAVLASSALALHDLPRARGVLMALGNAPLPAIEEVQTPTCTEGLSVGVDGWVCVGAGRATTASGLSYEGVFERAVGSTQGLWVAAENETRHVGETSVVQPGRGLLYADGDRAARLLRLEISLLDAAGRHVLAEPCGEVRSHRSGAWSPEGFWVVCLDGTAVRTSLDGEQLRVPLEGVHTEIYDIGFHDGVLLLVTSVDTIERWDVASGSQLASIRPGLGRIRRLAVSGTGDWLLIEGDHAGPVLWDARQGRARMRLPRRWKGAVFQRDGRLATAGGGLTLLEPSSVVDPSLYSEAGLSMAGSDWQHRRIVGALGDGSVRVWDANTGEVVRDQLVLEGFVTKWAAFSPDGSELVAATVGSSPPSRFSTADWSLLPTFPVAAHCRRLLVLDGAVWGLGYGHGMPVRLDAPQPVVPHTTSFHDASQNGPEVGVALDQLGGVVLVRASGITPVATIAEAGRVDVTAAGDLVVVGGPLGVHLLLPDGTEVGRIPLPSMLQDVAISADGAWIAVAFLDGSARVWRREDLALRAILEGVHTERISSLQFAGDTLITAGWDGRVHRWSLTPLLETPLPSTFEDRWQLPLTGLVDAG